MVTEWHVMVLRDFTGAAKWLASGEVDRYFGRPGQVLFSPTPARG